MNKNLLAKLPAELVSVRSFTHPMRRGPAFPAAWDPSPSLITTTLTRETSRKALLDLRLQIAVSLGSAFLIAAHGCALLDT